MPPQTPQWEPAPQAPQPPQWSPEPPQAPQWEPAPQPPQWSPEPQFVSASPRRPAKLVAAAVGAAILLLSLLAFALTRGSSDDRAEPAASSREGTVQNDPASPPAAPAQSSELGFLELAEKLQIDVAAAGLTLAQPYSGSLGSITIREERGVPRIPGLSGRDEDDVWLIYIFYIESQAISGMDSYNSFLDFEHAALQLGYRPVAPLTYENAHGDAMSVNIIGGTDRIEFDLVLASRPLTSAVRGETPQEREALAQEMASSATEFFTRVEETLRTSGPCQSIEHIYPIESLTCQK